MGGSCRLWGPSPRSHSLGGDRPKTVTRLFLLIIFGLSLIASCGSANETSNVNASVATQLPPVIARVSPTSGRAGDSVTIFGFGFSSAAASNVINVGGQAVAASSYALLNPPAAGEIESLTFAVPSGATTGAGGIFVTVFELTSNADVQFIVNP